MKTYSKATFDRLVLYVRNDDDNDKEWLINNGSRELVEFWDAVEGMESSFKWLLDNNYKELAATVDCFNGNDQAKLFLIKSGHRQLAAFVDACSGNKTAIAFLNQHDHENWVNFAKEVFAKDEKKEKRGFWGALFNLGNPFR